MSTTEPQTTGEEGASAADLLRPEVNADFIGLGFGEMVYLTLFSQNDTAMRSLEHLRLDDRILNDDVQMAAVSSLYARGYLETTDGENFRPAAGGAAITYALGTATVWISVAFLAGDASDSLMIVLGEEVPLLLTQRIMGSYYVTFLEPGFDQLELLWSVIERQLEQEPASTVFINIDHNDESPSSTIFVRQHVETAGVTPPAPDGTPMQFDVAMGEGLESSPPLLPGAKSEEDVDALLEAALRLEPREAASPA